MITLSLDDLKTITEKAIHIANALHGGEYAEGYAAGCRYVMTTATKLGQADAPAAEIKGKAHTKVYSFTEKSLAALAAQIKEQADKDAIRDMSCVVATIYMVCTLSALHKQYGYTKAMPHIATMIQDKFEEVMGGWVNYYELAEALKDECGVTIDINRADGSTMSAEYIIKEMSGIKYHRVVVKPIGGKA